jgi:hypothetical protein
VNAAGKQPRKMRRTDRPRFSLAWRGRKRKEGQTEGKDKCALRRSGSRSRHPRTADDSTFYVGPFSTTFPRLILILKNLSPADRPELRLAGTLVPARLNTFVAEKRCSSCLNPTTGHYRDACPLLLWFLQCAMLIRSRAS